MANYKGLFMRHMDNTGIKYSVESENAVSVSYSADNLDTIKTVVFFDKDGDNDVHFWCPITGTVPDNRKLDMLDLCNQLNKKYRWLKFYISSDRKDVEADSDEYVDVDSCGEECMSHVKRFVGIVDEVYPQMMKVLWS